MEANDDGDPAGARACAGVRYYRELLRPVFEVRPAPAQQSGSSGGASAYVLQPGAAVGRSALWLFTAKRIEIAGGGFVALG
ncbi:MAG: hypothetical protein GY953_06315 [bacterium]|nr:hypothetical protein [bacterium]